MIESAAIDGMAGERASGSRRPAVAVLLVSPDPRLRLELRQRLCQPRWELIEALTGADALDRLYRGEVQVLLVGPVLPDLEPVEFTALVRRDFPQVQVLTVDARSGDVLAVSDSGVSGSGVSGPEIFGPEVSGAAAEVSSHLAELFSRPGGPPGYRTGSGSLLTESLLAGVLSADVLPTDAERVVAIDRRAVFFPPPDAGPCAGRNKVEPPDLRRSPGPSTRPGIPGMVGDSAPMLRVYELVHMVAPRDTTVVVTGESGTGKDLVAQAIHNLSPRQRQPFVVINCAAIPEPLLEAELFGYVKGSFTGATQNRIGRIHAAHGGTLFLDEIGDMPLALQSKILRFLEQGEVQRLGGNDNLKVDVRVVAATNADLKSSVERGSFREDLYYRLLVFPVRLPPLRERMADLGKLATAFAARFGSVLGADALDALERHRWPGNVRELRNVIERAAILASGEAASGIAGNGIEGGAGTGIENGAGRATGSGIERGAGIAARHIDL